MDLVQAIVYGIVQGITEWLPISSTAHLRIVPALLGWSDPGAGFTAIIQLGTVLAVWIYFRHDLARAIKAWAVSLRTGDRSSVDAKMGWAVFWGTIPIIVLGFLLKKQIKSDELRSLYVIAGSLIVMGLLMLVAERVAKKHRTIETVEPKDGIFVGLWQCCSLIPGMSRSGSTITGALFNGFDPGTAARFSFLLSFPSVLAAGLYELIDGREYLRGPNLAPTLMATAVSFVVGYASIAFLIKYLQKHGTAAFVIYRVVLGVILLGLIQSGRLTAVQARTPDPAPAVTADVP